MFQVTVYLLACSMGPAMVFGTNLVMRTTNAVKGYELQCRERGPFIGACTSQNVAGDFGSGFKCSQLVCAKAVSATEYEAVETGMVLDGTQCTKHRVCMKGRCVLVGQRNVPPQEGDGPKYKCRQPVIRHVSGPQAISTTPGTSGQSPRKTVIVSPTRTGGRKMRSH